MTMPARALARVAFSGSRLKCQTTLRSTRPPSRGRPGSRLSAVIAPLVIATFSHSSRASEPSAKPSMAATPHAVRSSETIGPLIATAYSRAGVCGGSVISVSPASSVMVMLRTGSPNARATTQ